MGVFHERGQARALADGMANGRGVKPIFLGKSTGPARGNTRRFVGGDVGFVSWTFNILF